MITTTIHGSEAEYRWANAFPLNFAFARPRVQLLVVTIRFVQQHYFSFHPCTATKIMLEASFAAWDFVSWAVMCKLGSRLALEKDLCSGSVLSAPLWKTAGCKEPLFHRRVKQHPRIPRKIRSEPFWFTFLLNAAESLNPGSLLSVALHRHLLLKGASICQEMTVRRFPLHLQMDKRVIRLPARWQWHLFKWDNP